MFNKKLHFKMYKSGKNWVVAGITTLAVAAGLSLTTFDGNISVHADTTPNTTAQVKADSSSQAAAKEDSAKADSTKTAGQTNANTANNDQKQTPAKTADQKQNTNTTANNTNTQKQDQNTNKQTSQPAKTTPATDSKAADQKQNTNTANNTANNNQKQDTNKQTNNTTPAVNVNTQPATDHNSTFKSNYTDPSKTVKANTNTNQVKVNAPVKKTTPAKKTAALKFNRRTKRLKYYSAAGKNLTGKRKISGRTYSFSKYGLKSKAGSRKIAGSWYLFGRKSKLRTGFQRLGKKRVYYSKTTAKQLRGFRHIGIHRYYFSKRTGAMLFGFRHIGKYTYYFDKKRGYRAHGQKKINGRWYYFNAKGMLQHGLHYVPSAKKLAIYSPVHGRRMYGWHKVAGRRFYFAKKNGGALRVRKTGNRKINGKYYFFGNKTQLKTGFVTIKTTKKVKGKNVTTSRVAYYSKRTAQQLRGWRTINGNRYYFTKGYGTMLTGTHTIAGDDITFGKNGVLIDAPKVLATQFRDSAAQKIVKAVKSNYNINLDADRNNQHDSYHAFAASETAQLLAQGDLAKDNYVIAKNMSMNNLINGQVERLFSKTYTISKNNMDKAADQATKDFTATFKNSGKIIKNNDMLGVGAVKNGNKLTTSILLFRETGVVPEAQEATSTLNGKITAVYDTQKLGQLKAGQALPKELQNQINQDVYAGLLTGQKGQTIDPDRLIMIYDAINGVDNTPAYNGKTIVKKGDDGKNYSYHYEYWMAEPAKGQTRQQMFINANKNVKYGDPINFEYTATSKFGAAPAKQVSKLTGVTPDQLDKMASSAAGVGNGNIWVNQNVTIKKVAGIQNQIRGVDVSSYPALMKAGVKFYDAKGNQVNLFKALKDAGVSHVRLRLWNDPYNAKNQPYGAGDDNLTNVVEMAREANANGLKVLLDFHYSDFWADPAKQTLPKAWKNLSNTALQQAYYNYTAQAVTTMAKNGIVLDSVQIGNEITDGMPGAFKPHDPSTWTDPKLGPKLTGFLNNASKAVRSTSPTTKIIVHIETPNVAKYRTIMQTLKNAKVSYDILGTSYYTYWGNTPQVLTDVIHMAQKEFGKKVCAMENGWTYSDQTFNGKGDSVGHLDSPQFPQTVQGQIDELNQSYTTMIKAGGLGIYYWEPAWLPVKAGWGNNTWEYNQYASNVFGTGWASKYVIGYEPDAEMYYTDPTTHKTIETWGASTWTNQTFWSQNGNPLSSLYAYNGMLNGTQAPTNVVVQDRPAVQLASKLNFNVTNVDDGNLQVVDGLKKGDTLTLDDLAGILSDDDIKSLTGSQGYILAGDDYNVDNKLKTVAQGLKDGYTDLTLFKTKDGKSVQYTIYLDYAGNRDAKSWDIWNANKSVQAGNDLNVNISVVAKEVGNTAEVRSTVKPVISSITDENANYAGFKAGDALPADQATAVKEAIKADLLKGKEGTVISQDTLKQIFASLPGNTQALADSKTYTGKSDNKGDDRKGKATYNFWLQGQSADDKLNAFLNANKGVKYGDAITIPYQAAPVITLA